MNCEEAVRHGKRPRRCPSPATYRVQCLPLGIAVEVCDDHVELYLPDAPRGNWDFIELTEETREATAGGASRHPDRSPGGADDGDRPHPAKDAVA